MKKILIVMVLVVSLALLFMACSKSSDNTAVRNYLGTQSPGDVWSWTIITDDAGNGTFSAKNETLDKTYSGAVSTLPNKFLKLLVTATTDTNVSPLPAPAYALEVPGTALVVKPAGSDSNVIVAVAQGECPTQSATYNIVEMTKTGWNSTVDPAYDVANTTVMGATIDATVTLYLLNGSPKTTETVTGFTCSGGRIAKPGDPTVIGVTPSGAIIKDGGPGSGGFFGMQAPAADVDLNDVVLAGREYRAVTFKDQSSGSDDVRPHWGRPDGSGGLKGGDYTDFEAGTEDTAYPGTFTFTAQNSKGIVNGTKTDRAGTVNIVFMINKIAGKYFIYGISVESSTGAPELFIAIER